MRSDTVFKQAFNRALDLAATDPRALDLSENALRERLDVSRTTVRKVLVALADRGILAGDGGRTALRPPGPADRFPDTETTSRGVHVERQFMDWMLRADARPGTLFNELELARQFRVATSVIREFLIGFSRFGLVEKRPNSGWLFRGFTPDFALELFEVRVLFEQRSARHFVDLPTSSPVWGRLALIRDEHLALGAEIDRRYHDFSSLDTRFHLLVHSVVPNRFIDDFHGIIALIFHYHYQWNKVSERARNAVAITEHLTLIDALFSRDAARIEAACRAHMTSARTTLTQSLIQPSPGPG
jgi:DNA-binding GntR family transcriptional regulator